jgi:hypothetical protein
MRGLVPALLRPRGLLFGAGWLLAGALATTSAPAQAPDSERLIQLGVELRRVGNDEEALKLFTKAAAMEPSPRAQAQIGLALQALGRWIDAERALADALARADDPWVVRYRDLLESALSSVQGHLAWIDVRANASAGEVWVGGRRAAELPLREPLRVAAGRVVLEVQAPGYVASRRETDVESNAHGREDFVLEPIAPVAERPAGHTAAWIAAGAAGALLAGAIVATVVRENNAAIYNDDSRCFQGAVSRYQQCGSYRDTSATAQTLAIIGYSGAGVAAIASAVLVLWPPSTPPRSAAYAGCTLGLGLSCGGVF